MGDIPISVKPVSPLKTVFNDDADAVVFGEFCEFCEYLFKAIDRFRDGLIRKPTSETPDKIGAKSGSGSDRSLEARDGRFVGESITVDSEAGNFVIHGSESRALELVFRHRIAPHDLERLVIPAAFKDCFTIISGNDEAYADLLGHTR